MPNIRGKSGLLLPEKTKERSNQITMTLESLQEWRNQLVISDMSATARSLIGILQDSHQANISYQDRFEILSFLRPSLLYLTKSPPSQPSISELICNLYLEMVNGYKLIIEDINNSFFINKKLLLASLQNAMYYCTKMIFDAYDQHRNPPIGAWLELHSLFIFVLKKNMAQKSLINTIEWQGRSTTLENMYKHSLLFAIAHPYRLRHEEITLLSFALDSWAPFLILEKQNPKTSSSFIVDLTTDAGPKSTLYIQYPPQYYSLILDKVTQRLKKLLALQYTYMDKKLTQSFSASELDLPLTLIESLVAMWEPSLSTIRERQKTQGKIDVALGISASNSLTYDAIVSSQSMSDDTEKHSNRYSRYSCEIIDQSEEGYCLKWPPNPPTSLQCGEIIALEKVADGQKKLSIGTIRWLKNEQDNSVLMGIQLLTAKALPAKARLPGVASIAIPTLLSPPIAQKKPPTLITPLHPFKSEQEVELEIEGVAYSVSLQKNYSHSSYYQEFGVVFLNPKFDFT